MRFFESYQRYQSIKKTLLWKFWLFRRHKITPTLHPGYYLSQPTLNPAAIIHL